MAAPSTDAPACHASDLSTAADDPAGLTGEAAYELTFTNTSGRTCLLAGAPATLVAVAADGARDPVDTTHGFIGHPPFVPADIPPGGHTRLPLLSERGCEAAITNRGRPAYARLMVGLPDGTQVTVPTLDGGYRFDWPPVAVSDFGVLPPAPTYGAPPLIGAKASLELPATVHAGSVLRYVVELTNPSDHDVALAPCPGYVESAEGFGDAVKQAFALNCDIIQAIPAGNSVRYGMQLDVPVDAPTGIATVYWAVSASEGPSARGIVRVVD